MDLLCKTENWVCPHYDSSLRPSIEIKEITDTRLFEELPIHSKIIFLLDGQLTYSFGIFNNCVMSEKQMLFLPPNYHFTFKARDQAHVLIIRLYHKIQFCETYNIDNLDYQYSDKDMMLVDNNKPTPFLLEMNREMDAYINNLLIFVQKGLSCRYYFEMKIKELFYVFKAFYTKEELAHFFRKALGMDANFSFLVLHNYHKYKTLSDMAADMNMTLSGFEKRFKKVFGTSACKWINQHKAKKIYHAICNDQSTFKELSSRFGFSSQSTFNDFCKKNLGISPGKIRERIQPGRNKENLGENK